MAQPRRRWRSNNEANDSRRTDRTEDVHVTRRVRGAVAGLARSDRRERDRLVPAEYLSWRRADRERHVLELVKRTHSGVGSSPLVMVRRSEEPGDARVVPDLAWVLEVESDLEILRLATHGLAQVRDPAATDPLVHALGSSDQTVRVHAIRGLARLRARPALPRLIDLLDDRSVRVDAARALVAIRDERALEPLRHASGIGLIGRRKLRHLADELAREVGAK
jgi:hypothetical protein